MKSKHGTAPSEKSLIDRLEKSSSTDVNKRLSLERRSQKRIASNPVIQKNLQFLKSYGDLLKKPQQHFGDADSYFRKSLRNFKSLDLVRELQINKAIKSKNNRKQKSHFTSHHCENTFSPVEFYTPTKNLSPSTSEAKPEFQELYLKDTQKTLYSSESEDENHKISDNQIETQISLERTDISRTMADEEVPGETVEEPQLIAEEQETAQHEPDPPTEPIEEALPTDPEETLVAEQDNVEADKHLTDAEDDELKDVEEMIQQASDELQKVAENSKEIIENLKEDKEAEGNLKEPTEKGEQIKESVFKFDPAVDAAVLRELEDAEKQAKITAGVIADLKSRVAQLLEKEQMTETEAKELEEKNKALKAQMIIFEEKTRRIQALLGQANLFDKMTPVSPPLQRKHPEDKLPQMLVFGADDLMPKIVCCEDRNKKSKHRDQRDGSPTTRKLNESYIMQEKLVSENANLEDTRHKLQSDLMNKDKTVEYLQRQLYTLQNQMMLMCQEQSNQQSNKTQSCKNPNCPKKSRTSSPTRNSKMACGPAKQICPAEVENRLQQYSKTTHMLEKQLGDMEVDVRHIQQEILEVQKEREHLEYHRKLLCPPPPPCRPSPPCYPSPPMSCPPMPCGPMPICCPPESLGDDIKYKELREQYNRLQDDFKAKLTEVASLRAENEKLKDLAKAAEEARNKLQEKVKELERKIKELRGDVGTKGSGTREQIVELEQQLKVHKEMFRQAQDELEELRALVEDIQYQLNDYRNKYLEAIQTVEEQRRQMDIMKMENNRISEEVNLEILRVKNQFQEKLQELAPLPDILKATQMKLQEAQQLHLLAERNNEVISRELQSYKDKLTALTNEMELKSNGEADELNEQQRMRKRVEELEAANEEMTELNSEMTVEMERAKEKAEDSERQLNEKLHEITQLESQLEAVREESARTVTRTKDRCEIVRKSMQNQISDLERQLAQLRATCKAAERDRDEIRAKMQAQIRNLNENFEDAQMRIRNLQGHVGFLKSSYLPTGQNEPVPNQPDPCTC